MQQKKYQNDDVKYKIKRLTASARDNCIRNSLATRDTRSSLGTYAKPCNNTKITKSWSKSESIATISKQLAILLNYIRM